MLAIVAVPIAVVMLVFIVLLVSFYDLGIRGEWRLFELGLMLCGVIYPALALLAFKKVRQQADLQLALVWALLPVPVLLILMLLVLHELRI